MNDAENRVKLKNCSEINEHFKRELRAVMKITNGTDFKLASDYLKKVIECQETFNSCYYEDMTGNLGCSCPMFGITLGWQLKLNETSNECKGFEALDFATNDIPGHPRRIKKNFETLLSIFPSDIFSFALTDINNWVEMDRNWDYLRQYQICTCTEDKCNQKKWTSSSLQCHEISTKSEKITSIPHLRNCSSLMKKYIRELEYVENVATPQDSKLASKYLKLVRECPEKFDSCFYNEAVDISGCSCPMFYIVSGKPLRLTKNDCAVFNLQELQHNLHIEKIKEELGRLDTYLQKQKLSLLMAYEKLNTAITLNRNTYVSLFQLCTCDTPKCNTQGIATSKSPLKCYKKRKTDLDSKLVDCNKEANEWVKMFKYLIRVGNDEVSRIASYYLPLATDCKNNFGSCISDEIYEHSGCTCIHYYVLLVQPLKLKKDECRYFSWRDIGRRWNELVDLSEKTTKDFVKMESYLHLEKGKTSMRISMKNRFTAEYSKRNKLDYRICTCSKNKCNTFGLNNQTLLPESSLQCYVEETFTGEHQSEPKVKNCSDETNLFIELFQHVERFAGGMEIVAIASKYLKMVKECPTKYDSCIYEDLSGSFDCFCPMYYILFGPDYYPSSSSKECTELDRSSLITMKSHLEEGQEDFRKIQNYLRRTNLLPVQRGFTSNLNQDLIPSFGISLQKSYRVCICIGSNCNTNELIKTTLQPTILDYEQKVTTTINNAIILSFSYCFLHSLIIEVALTFALLNLA